MYPKSTPSTAKVQWWLFSNPNNDWIKFCRRGNAIAAPDAGVSLLSIPFLRFKALPISDPFLRFGLSTADAERDASDAALPIGTPFSRFEARSCWCLFEV